MKKHDASLLTIRRAVATRLTEKQCERHLIRLFQRLAPGPERANAETWAKHAVANARKLGIVFHERK